MDPWEISSAAMPSEEFLASLCSTLQDLEIDPRELERISPRFLNFLVYLQEDIGRLEDEVMQLSEDKRALHEQCMRLRQQRDALFKETGRYDSVRPDPRRQPSRHGAG